MPARSGAAVRGLLDDPAAAAALAARGRAVAATWPGEADTVAQVAAVYAGAAAVTRLLLLVVLLVLAVPVPAQAQVTGPVVVVGVPGLRWTDVGPGTPALLRLLDDGAVGALSVKALPEVSCPADGALTLLAGARAQAFDVPVRAGPGRPRGAGPPQRREPRRRAGR